jgi:hypothetical protein
MIFRRGDVMSNGGMQRLLGGPPGAVLARLAFMSVLVGAFLAVFGLTPPDIVLALRDLFHDLFGFGFDALKEAGRYFLYGAMIVVPLWVLLRILGRG